MQIFMDQEINDAMIYPKGLNSSCRRMLVNDHHHMSKCLRDFDFDFITDFISVFFLIEGFFLDLGH